MELGRCVLTAAVLLAATSLEAGDLTLRYRLGATAGLPSALYAMNDHALRVSTEASDRIVDVDRGRLISIDAKRKLYYEAVLDEARRTLKTLAGGSRKGSSAPEAKLSKAEGTKRIKGHPCERYIVTVGDQSLEVWMATDLPRPSHLLDSWFVADLAKSPIGAFAGQAFAALEPTDGLPLALTWNVVLDDRKLSVEWTVIELSEQELPASTFVSPAGYQRAIAAASSPQF